MHHHTLRQKIISLCRQMNASGLNQGTSGNISVRHEGYILITPSGIPYDELKPAHIARLPFEGDAGDWDGPCKPSSEWHFHRAILQAKPQFDAVVHAHSTFATALAIAGMDIPACHYMIAAFGGNSVRCAAYATFGTAGLSARIVEAMQDRSACLLANHGMVVAGETLEKAMAAAVDLEALCRQYYHARLLGTVSILADDEMQRVLEKFRNYGQPPMPLNGVNVNEPPGNDRYADDSS